MKGKPTIKKYKMDWDKLNRMKDSEIDTSDIPELDEKFWKNAKLRLPTPKKMVSIRIDEDILAWYKKQGRGYQTKINAILRTYMESKAA